MSRHAILILAFASGCPLPFEGPMPDFQLTDENPNSASYQLAVSPRDYEGQVSAWYFGHAN